MNRKDLELHLKVLNQNIKDLQNLNPEFIQINFEDFENNKVVNTTTNMLNIQEIKRLVLLDLLEQKEKILQLLK